MSIVQRIECQECHKTVEVDYGELICQNCSFNPIKYVDIVFDGPPSNESGRFIEVEDGNGNSIQFGKWIEGEEYWYLRIPILPENLKRFNVNDVCKRYQVGEHTVLAWIENGDLQAINVGTELGKQKPRWRFSEEDLKRFENLRMFRPTASEMED